MSHMHEHVREAHPEQDSVENLQQAAELFEIKPIRRHPTALSRQLYEAIRIKSAAGSSGILNNREEYSRCVIPILSTSSWNPKPAQPSRALDPNTETEPEINMKIGRNTQECMPQTPLEPANHSTVATRPQPKRVRLEFRGPREPPRRAPKPSKESENSTRPRPPTVREMIVKMQARHEQEHSQVNTPDSLQRVEKGPEGVPTEDT